MKPECIIKAIHDRRQPINDRIAAIEGRRYVPRPVYYQNTETGAEYFHVAGSIAFPAGKAPGFALVIGVLKEPGHEKPRLQVLTEVEEKDLFGLLAACERIRWKWGYPRQLLLWSSDFEHFMQAVSEFNEDLESKSPDKTEGIHLNPPADFEEPRRDQLYKQSVYQLLRPCPQGGKRLLIGDNPRLRTHLQNVPPDIGKVEEIPALAALSYACHTILATTPWQEFTEPQRFEPTIKDGFARVNVLPWETEEALSYDDVDWFDDDDSGDLVSTVPE